MKIHGSVTINDFYVTTCFVTEIEVSDMLDQFTNLLIGLLILCLTIHDTTPLMSKNTLGSLLYDINNGHDTLCNGVLNHQVLLFINGSEINKPSSYVRVYSTQGDRVESIPTSVRSCSRYESRLPSKPLLPRRQRFD